MTRASKPAVERTGGDLGPAKVWAEVKVTVRPAEYEGITVTMGEARDCEDTRASRRTVRREIFKECEEAVLREARKIKRDW